MHASTLILFFGITCRVIYAEVSEDCRWGRKDAASCCEDISDEDPTHLANPNKCSSYYICKSKKPVLQQCPSGDVWCIENNKCVSSSNPEKCPQRSDSVSRAKVSQNCLWGKTSASKCCKSIPNGDSTHLANPKDCTSFYVCRNNKPVLYPCSAGEIWSVEDQKCDSSSTTEECPQVS